MKVSILLRGFHFLEKDRFGYSMDARDNLRSLIEKFVSPVREEYPGARLFLATYDSPALADVVAQLQPCEIVPLNADATSQIETYKQGLKHVFENDDCDAVIVTRFDLNFRKAFRDWELQIDDAAVTFTFKETLVGWRDHNRVGDTVHVIGRKSMGDFYSALIMNQLARRSDLHLLYYFMRILNGNIRFLDRGYWDSNSLYANPECDNPLYTIFNRPRLPDLAPYTGTMPKEVKGE